MKSSKIVVLIALTLLSFSVNAQKSKSPGSNKTSANAKSVVAKVPVKGTHMTFDQEVIKLGKIKKGDIKKFDFVFTNTGTDIIEIDIASGCDCTDLEYPKNKIAPGKKATINVTFNSGKKEGNETSTDVDLYLKNLNPKTGQRILKILKFEYEFVK